MSRRKSLSDQMAEDIGCLVFGLLWLAVVGVFTLIFKASQTPPEEKLRKLQPGYTWLWLIEALDCVQCGAVNESYMRQCSQCGAELAAPLPVEAATLSVESSSTDARTNPNETAIGLAILATVFVVIIIISLSAR